MEELSYWIVETWVKTVATGEFHYKQILNGTVKPDSFGKLRRIMFDLCKAGICEPIGRRDGYYRLISEMPEPVDWQGINPTKDFPIVLPFGLRDYVWIDPGTTIGVTGAKDSGKTLFLMLTVVLNMNNKKIKVVFISNLEEGVNQLKRRFDAMGVPSPAPFVVLQAIDNFHDFITEPDTLYVIDYIDVPESGEFYMIGPAMAKIQVKLKYSSVAVIGLQKKRGSDFAYGGEGTAKKTTLYLAMDNRKLKIVSGKVPVDPSNLPTNMQWTFKYNSTGSDFTNIERYYGEEPGF